MDEQSTSRRSFGNQSAMPDILLVEDNPLHVRLVKSMLADIWADAENLRFAKRLDRALQLVREREPACVLLDLVLPDAQDLEAVKAMLAVAPGVPIVVLSSHEDDEMAMEAVKHGAQDYLVKGTVGPDQLARAIYFAMQRHRPPPGPVDEPEGAKPAVAAAEASSAAPDSVPSLAVDADAPFVVVDRRGVVLFAQPGFADLVGRDVTEVIGTSLGDYTHPNDEEIVRTAFSEREDPLGDTVSVTLRMRHASGNNLRVRLLLSPLADHSGEHAVYVGKTHAIAEIGTAASGAYTVVTEWVGG